MIHDAVASEGIFIDDFRLVIKRARVVARHEIGAWTAIAEMIERKEHVIGKAQTELKTNADRD